MNRLLKWLRHDHLPPHLQAVVKPIDTLAQEMDGALAEGAEKTAGMRKLVEAKDCFVRARIEQDEEA
ncbi:hypothetical protein [Paracoccus sp. TOH]|uniref:Uncharacterized protein n=1 Tax=Paracoccus simplex TaxID=2086346 RepID=A0ABV7RU74_9RHOB|nr:hypothetical protein [Paracoccus sp. TOH]WJS86733.1 hypothetical protein NBE95_19925 [Paracoccus sp. TOH]